MESKDENSRFISKLKEHRGKFKLTQGDLADLINVKQSKISRMESGIKIVDLNEAASICKVFGKFYSEIMAPGYEIPEYEELPLKTQQKIDERMELGVQDKDYDKKLNKKLDAIIYGTEILHIPATAKDILNSFSKEDKKLFTVSLINNYLGDTPRNNRVVQIVGEKRDGMILYILKEFYDNWKDGKEK